MNPLKVLESIDKDSNFKTCDCFVIPCMIYFITFLKGNQETFTDMIDLSSKISNKNKQELIVYETMDYTRSWCETSYYWSSVYVDKFTLIFIYFVF